MFADPFHNPSSLRRQDIDFYDSKCTLSFQLNDSVLRNPTQPDIIPACDLAGLNEWVKQYILLTSESMLNILDYGSSTKWFFYQCNQDRVFSSHILQKLHHGALQRVLAVFIVPPWAITLEVFRSLADIEVVRDLRSATKLRVQLGGCCDLTPAELLWCEVSIIVTIFNWY